jgi:anti-sigma regulatory factor (Ser/Thr protein kinase)
MQTILNELIFKHPIDSYHNLNNILLSIEDVLKKLKIDKQGQLKILTASKEAILNVIKYAQKGTIEIHKTGSKHFSGLKIVVDDIGVGVKNITACLKHGYSSAKTMGVGLNVILNSMDYVMFVPKKDGFCVIFYYFIYDKRMHCIFRKRTEKVDIAMKIEPFSSYKESGDCGAAIEQEHYLLFAHWDVEGHGSAFVFENSKTILKYLVALSAYPIESILHTINYLVYTHEKLKRSSILIGSVDKTTNHLTIYRLGNINYTIYKNSENIKSRDASGVLGIEQINPKKESFTKDEWESIITFSDGIARERLPKSQTGFICNNSYEIADKIINSCSKEDDDASVLVIKKIKTKT